MNTRISAWLLVVPFALAAGAGMADRALGQTTGERPDLRPLSFEEVEIAGGYTHGLVTGDGAGSWLATGRQIQPIDLTDPTAPDIAGEPERLPDYLRGMTRRDGVTWANDGEALWHRGPAEAGEGTWQRTWRLTDGTPVPSENPGNSFDYFRRIILPEDRPELILLLTRGGLRVLQVDAAGMPAEVAYVPRSSERHWTVDIAYAPGHVYFIESYEYTISLRGFDLVDPTRPIEAETYQVDFSTAGTPGASRSPWILRAEGERIYLVGTERLVVLAAPVAGEPGLPPSMPLELGSLALDTRTWNLLPDGDLLWIIGRDEVLDPPFLRGIDIADPSRPRWLSTALTLEPTFRIPTSYSYLNENYSPGIGMARSGDHLLLSDGVGGTLRTVDVHDPAAPRIAGSLDRLGECGGTIRSAGWTYCATADGLIPLADGEGRPLLVQEAGTALESLYQASAVPIEDGVAWFDPESKRLRIYGIDPPALPILFAEIELPDAFLLDVVGQHIYFTAGEPGLQNQPDRLLVVDIGNPRQPAVVKTLDLPVEGIVSSAVGDGSLFLSSYDEGLLAYDISLPTEPRLVGRYHGIPDIRPDIAWHQGSLIVFPHGSPRTTDVIVLDASDPAGLRERARYALDDFYAVAENSVVSAVDDERGEIYVYVYREAGSGIAVLNISDPDHIRRVADLEAYGVRDIQLDGNRVFISSESLGVSIWERRQGEPPPSLYLPSALNTSARTSP